jgi:AAA domain
VINVEKASRDEARAALRVYMAKTGMTLSMIADRTEYARQTLSQFVSKTRCGTINDESSIMAGKLLAFISSHPARMPEMPGRLYETEATRQMDSLIGYCARGRWGILYGPAGSQKSFLLEYRHAEASRHDEPRVIWIEAYPRMTPRTLLKRIGSAIGAPFGQYTEDLRQNVLWQARERRTPFALVIDEADQIYSEIATLEMLRRIGDALRGRMGIIVAGNEQIEKLFSPRRGRYFEQWRSRVEQRQIRVLGPSRTEARQMVRGELGEVKEATVERIIDGCTVEDPKTMKKYVNVRRLFNTIRDLD